jgi:thioredoxin 1
MSISVNEATFETVVLGSDIPVLVHFWAPWCGLCKMIAPLLNRFQTEWEDNIRVVDVNADESLRLASTYRLTTLPTLLFFHKGQLCNRVDTFRGQDDLRLALDAFMRQHALAEETPDLVKIIPYS